VAESLLELLEAGSGIVCAVGAGGKKSVLNLLAAGHSGRTALTASVVTTLFPPLPGREVVVEDDERALADRIRRVPRRASVAYARPIDKPGRLGGVSLELIERIHAEGGFAATYVKADGARMRWIKAPAADEPVVPAACTTLIGVVSARAIGEPLEDRVAHRVEELCGATGLVRGERISPAHVGRLIASPAGLMKRAQGRAMVPVINMVDDAGREALAREAAEAALDLAPWLDRVVLTRLDRPEDPVVAVIRR
jgi:probable selenium-dependent hydroxylase accessory protein YqeC